MTSGFSRLRLARSPAPFTCSRIAGAAGRASLSLRATAALVSLACCAGASTAGRARVSVRCDDGDAALIVDGVPRGTAADYSGAHRLLLAPGAHRLELRGHGAVETRLVQVGSDDDVTLNIALGAGARAAAQGVSR